jgi:hypothetical protein
LADLLEDTLSVHGVCLKQVAADKQLNIFNRHTSVFQRQQGGISAELGDIFVWVSAKFNHADAEYVHVSHTVPPYYCLLADCS